MQLEFEKKENGLWVGVSGELDMTNADRFRDELQKAINLSTSRNLLLDFSDVKFIDSSGLGVILGRYRELQPFGGEIKILGVSPHVYRVLHLSGLTKIIEVQQSRGQRSEAGGQSG